jgi:hypothetical protein
MYRNGTDTVDHVQNVFFGLQTSAIQPEKCFRAWMAQGGVTVSLTVN